MTCQELIAELSKYPPDQYVRLALHSQDYPQGAQVAIQRIEPSPGWHGTEHVGIVAHAENAEVKKPEETSR